MCYLFALQIHKDTYRSGQWSTRHIEGETCWAFIQPPARSSCIIPFGCSSFFPCLFLSFLTLPFPFPFPFRITLFTIRYHWALVHSLLLLLTQPTQPNCGHSSPVLFVLLSLTLKLVRQVVVVLFVVVLYSLRCTCLFLNPFFPSLSFPPLSSFFVPLYLAFSLLSSPSLSLSLALSPSLVCSLVPCTYITTTHAHTS